jgi:hypothetical protein
VKQALAIIAALIAALSVTPYLIDIVHKKTKPNIVSWFTWLLLTAIATAAALAGHSPRSALLLAGSTFCSGAVVVLGLKYGIAKFSTFDILCQIGAILGLVLWLVFNSPDIGIIVPVAIDLMAVLPTLRHAWKSPGEETWSTFLAGSIASVFTIISLTHYNIASLLYPLYLLIANGTIVSAVLIRRKQFGIPFSRTGIHETLHE